MADPAISARVKAGAEWLDQHLPGWVADIDLNLLDISRPCRCILGQIHGGEYPTMGEIPGEDGKPTDWTTDRTALGFECSAVQVGETPGDWLVRTGAEYAALTEAWKQLVAARRTEAARVAAACCPCRKPACDPWCTCPSPECPKTLAEVLDAG